MRTWLTAWVDIQRQLVRKHDLIAEIEAETITYTRLGGYNSRPYSCELDILNGLSAKSLKGVLRWWSRVAVVGALGGTIDYAEANKYLKQIYGGVRRREGEKTTASKIQLTVFSPSSEQRAKDAQNIHQKHHESRDRLPPRMILLLMGRDQRVKEEELKTLETKNMKFKIQLLGERNPRLCNFVMASLLMALILGGVGSITKRGFGSLKLNRVDCERVVADKLIKIGKKLSGPSITADELEKTLRELVKVSIEYAKECFNLSGSPQPVGVPLAPSLDASFKVFNLKVVECQRIDLATIGEATLKSNLRIHTWMLGLPRSVRKSGYLNGGTSLRRMSSIGIRLFDGGETKFVIIYGFLSKDWPNNLKLLSKGMLIEKINMTQIEDTYRKTFEAVTNYLVKMCCKP
ncbi:MAG: type III-B CRISPR module RAMP protein Cmr1 [Candidatus Caldarchaeum sp.]